MTGSAFNPWQHGRKLIATAGAVAALAVGTTYAFVWGHGNPSGLNYSVAVTAPSNNASVSGGAITINAVCNGGCSGVQFEIDSVPLGTLDTTTPYTTTWDSTTAANGAHAVQAVGYNANGVPFATASATVQVANNTGAGNEFVSVTGSDTGTNCKRFSSAVSPPSDQTTWCHSWNKAYQLATCSDQILLGGGQYPTQSFSDNSAVRAACGPTTRVVMKPAPAATVTVANLAPSNNPGFSLDLNAASHLEIDNVSGDFTGCSNTGYSYATFPITITTGITSTGVYLSPPCPAFSLGGPTGTDNVVRSIHFSRQYCSGCTHSFVYNSDFGPSYDWHGIYNSSGTTSTAPRPHDILVQGTTTHDHYNTSEYQSGCPNAPTPGQCWGNAAPGCSACNNNQHHIGCGPTQNAAYYVTFNADQWVNCSIDTILIKPFVFGNHDITVENSYVGTCTNTLCAGLSKGFDLTCDSAGNSDTTSDYNISFLNDTIMVQGQLSTTSGVSCPGSQFLGNIYSGGNCGTMTTQSFSVNYNVSTSAACGGSSPNGLTVTSYGFAADGIHLAAGSAAIDFIPNGTAGVPSTDIDGDTRPCRTAIDAGADEACP